MGKFNSTATRTASGHGPIVSEQTSTGTTHEGGAGYARDARSELFLLAVTNMVGENTFYESADDRDSRYATLVRQVAVSDPVWAVEFLRWLRSDGNMRSAPLVGACEFVKARLDAKAPSVPAYEVPGWSNDRGLERSIVDAVLQRADEPGEAIAYWRATHGRRIPKPVKRGIADAARRLYTERNLLKYDTASKGYRFGDVLELVHAEPQAPWQGDLFKHAIDRRHGRENSIPETLEMVNAQALWRADVTADRGSWQYLLDPETIRAAGLTWEDVLSAVGGRYDKAKLWAALIPSMGYMALLRNLRNFDEAGVPDDVAQQVAARLANPDEVARSRQFPMRFLAAHRAAPSLRWGYPLEKALGHSLANIPKLGGRTLVLIDTSTSMKEAFSKDGTLMRWDAAVIFGVALAQRCAAADVVSFSSSQVYYGDPPGAKTKQFPLTGGESLLRSIDRWKTDGYFLGGGTDTAGALRTHYVNHDRVVIVTDEQAGSDPREVSASMPADRPLYTWNLAGYERGHAPSGRNRHTFGGLTDAGFRLVPLLEGSRAREYPQMAKTTD